MRLNGLSRYAGKPAQGRGAEIHSRYPTISGYRIAADPLDLQYAGKPAQGRGVEIHFRYPTIPGYRIDADPWIHRLAVIYDDDMLQLFVGNQYPKSGIEQAFTRVVIQRVTLPVKDLRTSGLSDGLSGGGVPDMG